MARAISTYEPQALFGDKIRLVFPRPFAAGSVVKSGEWVGGGGPWQFSFLERSLVAWPGSDIGVTLPRQAKWVGFASAFWSVVWDGVSGRTHQRGRLGRGFSLREEFKPIINEKQALASPHLFLNKLWSLTPSRRFVRSI